MRSGVAREAGTDAGAPHLVQRAAEGGRIGGAAAAQIVGAQAERGEARRVWEQLGARGDAVVIEDPRLQRGAAEPRWDCTQRVAAQVEMLQARAADARGVFERVAGGGQRSQRDSTKTASHGATAPHQPDYIKIRCYSDPTTLSGRAYRALHKVFHRPRADLRRPRPK